MTLLLGCFVLALGLAIGSFLNVVIYRLPNGLSVSAPRWSFCPHCRQTIRWHDNIPVLGWLLLRGRCRDCRAGISAQYPVVEALTGLTFVLLYVLLFVQHAREGVDPGSLRSALVLAAWLTLAAALIVCSGMDVTAYMIDTRVTDVALLAGLTCSCAWGNPDFCLPRAQAVDGAAGAAMFAACVVMLALTVWRSPDAAPESQPAPTCASATDGAGAPPRRSNLAGALAVLMLLALSGLLLTASDPAAATAAGASEPSAAEWRLPLLEIALPIWTPVAAAIAALFITIVLAAGAEREADAELHAAIEAEAPQARRVVLLELLWLSPILIAGAAAGLAVAYAPAASDLWSGIVRWQPVADFAPLAGLTFAMHGAMAGAALGWAVRIVFTLAFGREAFGVGDIFMLAAAGAAAGWDIALLGFLAAVVLATLGWLVGLTLKQTGMLPFGPWLAIGFVCALALSQPAAHVAAELAGDLRETIRSRPGLALTLLGILLAGGAVAITLARAVRRLVEPPHVAADRDLVKEDP